MTTQSRSLRFGLVIMALLAISTGLYPFIFAFAKGAQGLFTTKPEALLQTSWYVPMFMVHVLLGAVAIIAGSTQFFESWQRSYLKLHRTLGKIYVLTVIPSGLAGFVAGFYATGAWYSKAGFICLAIGWIFTTVVAYTSIRKKEINKHKRWMMRSYAFCFAFVTFRIYLGLGAALGIPFDEYYSYLSFLCWVPNIIFIEWRIKRLGRLQGSPL
ncbi:DUF2306 domain-containing protein [Gilvibacter sediminis]|uniref:DUF2306 domain-containing protein n=1 Tax=Gilvibacter sediminis TaxID=379071 RepID=UPI00235000E8|nr:DUF2306 domain-containing protein [Gilvibacter sediminis]MDC7997713.1 DUF2306 domain-containing protein [Gilvibacter sediminis]